MRPAARTDRWGAGPPIIATSEGRRRRSKEIHKRTTGPVFDLHWLQASKVPQRHACTAAALACKHEHRAKECRDSSAANSKLKNVAMNSDCTR